MLTFFLGAGFSYSAGVPTAARLFDEQPEVDLVVRRALVERVLAGWHQWRQSNQGGAEQYLSYLEALGGPDWIDAVWYVSLVIALKMGVLQREGQPTVVLTEPRDEASWVRYSAPNSRSYISHHSINRTTGIDAHEAFWSVVYEQTRDIAVITTNYDILAERGLRHQYRPRAGRLGFHYGFGNERLKGGGYSWHPKAGVEVSGRVPLLKLHGSVSWSLNGDDIDRFIDCRPAVRGDAFIAAPVMEKKPSLALRPIWDMAGAVLKKSAHWIVVGYSFPPYDTAAMTLLRESSHHSPEVHVFDPDQSVVQRVRATLPDLKVIGHPGLPAALGELASVCGRAERARWHV